MQFDSKSSIDYERDNLGESIQWQQIDSSSVWSIGIAILFLDCNIPEAKSQCALYAGKKKNDVRKSAVPSFSLYKNKSTGNHTKESFKPNAAIENWIGIATPFEYLAYAIVIFEVCDGFLTVFVYFTFNIVYSLYYGAEFEIKVEDPIFIDVK